MNRFASLTFAGIALGSMITVTAAADLTPEPVQVMEDWNGFYIGLHAGFGWGDADFNANDDSDFAGTLIENGFSVDMDGPIAGAQAGFNWTMGNFLLGIEGDVSWSGVEGDINIDEIDPPPPGYSFSADLDVDWLASIRGRAGFIWNSILLYGTGGIAFAGIDAGAASDYAGYPSPIHDSDSETHTGWVAGGGIEAMLTSNITGRVEFLHYQFDDDDFFFRFDPQSDAYDLFGDADFDVNVVRAGLNILF